MNVSLAESETSECLSIRQHPCGFLGYQLCEVPPDMPPGWRGWASAGAVEGARTGAAATSGTGRVYPRGRPAPAPGRGQRVPMRLTLDPPHPSKLACTEIWLRGRSSCLGRQTFHPPSRACPGRHHQAAGVGVACSSAPGRGRRRGLQLGTGPRASAWRGLLRAFLRKRRTRSRARPATQHGPRSAPIDTERLSVRADASRRLCRAAGILPPVSRPGRVSCSSLPAENRCGKCESAET
jgi:hypothetical protein